LASLTVLERQAYSLLPRANSDFFGALQDAVQVLDFDGGEKIAGAAAGHLAAFLDDKAGEDRFQPLFEMIVSPASVKRAFRPDPDTATDLRTGAEWLQTLPEGTEIVAELEREEGVHRGVTFLARTFLYVAYADARGVALTPDATRTPVLEQVVRAERNLRRRLIEKLGDAFSKTASAMTRA
jgi:hypothetical protein